MESTKRVVILDRLNSPVIAQAIFILKNESVDEFSAVYEAERIVEEYLTRTLKKKTNKLPIAIGVLSLLLFCTLYFALR